MTRVTIEQTIDGSTTVMSSTVTTTDNCSAIDELLRIVQQAIKGMGFHLEGDLVIEPVHYADKKKDGC